ncbi:transcriptional regulator [Paenibacillus sp. PK3_47]|uniref:AraC family transcriptional regulator n=1 Tax=Paenibacillus sp. PK3_47 TaxID=2072642 RepID=UPI00201DF521|nr:AraC family transcriptional regulator [Paenibacillus sp. PK3_47]UQZ34879.1 transcriptional regulator [Paenibacillus sp. PK3_47]
MNNNDYQYRIDCVLQYIKEHSGQKLNLTILAGVSHFSKYHFSRIFTAQTGVTPAVYVNRIRLQNAVTLLLETQKSVLEISQLCGYESVSTFNSLFKKYYGTTPSVFRKSSGRDSKIRPYSSKKPEEKPRHEDYNGSRTNNLLKRAWASMITFRELPEYKVAYVRQAGSYLDTQETWSRIGQWAKRQGITPDNAYFIGISRDDPDLVEDQACRYDACVTLPDGFAQQDYEASIEFATLPGGPCAVYSFYDTTDKLVLAYQQVFSNWLPHSGYEADDRPCLEFCLNDPAQDKEGKCRADLYIPVKSLNGRVNP